MQKLMTAPQRQTPNRSVRIPHDVRVRISEFRIRRFNAGTDEAILTESEAIRMLMDIALRAEKL